MKTCWLVLLLLGLGGAAHADRDIVYSARYYAPPGSHRTSHFHLYRINPDGTGKTQLTFGMTDQSDPSWSPDGKQVTFIAYSANSDAAALCRMDADGRNQRVLRALGESETLPDPATPGYRLENKDPGNDAETAKHILINLKTGRRLVLSVPTDNNGADSLLPAPNHGLVYASDDHNSTVGIDYLFYRLNPSTGALHYLTEGQFLAWSPDGSRFCVAPGRDTTPYEKRPSPYAADPDKTAQERLGDAYRLVWFAPLYVRAASGGKMRRITPRLSYVTGADWRKGT